MTGSGYLSDGQIAEALTKLRGALDQHPERCDDLYATLACCTTPRREDVDSSAHRKCGFGEWLYGDDAEQLRSRRAFGDIEREHETIHRLAREMLNASQAGDDIVAADFEAFRLVLTRLRLHLDTLRVELEDLMSQHDH
jgi:hypothetical protein